jgi:hypothetical protein
MAQEEEERGKSKGMRERRGVGWILMKLADV